jgi:cell division protein FtsZ
MKKTENMDDLDFEPESRQDIEAYQTTIRVLGVGGAGNNTINRLMRKPTRLFDTVAINTDAQDLLAADADKKILIGKNITAGLGSGGDPQLGEQAAEESHEILRSTTQGSDLVFITGGLGGGTGTGAMPVIGKLSRDQGALAIAIVTMPFKEEGMIRWENAQIGLEKLKKSVDSVIVLRNDKLLELYPDIPIVQAFQRGDEILLNALKGLSDLIVQKGLINLDFADISMVIKDGPNAVIGFGESSSENRTEEAARKAVTHPMMDMDISGAQSALIHILSGSDLTLKEARKVVHTVAQKLDPSARIIWGVSLDKTLKQTIRVTVIVSGLQEHEIGSYEKASESHIHPEESSGLTFGMEPEAITDNGKSIFDIKESILASGSEITTQVASKKSIPQTSHLFYKIFHEESANDLKRFDHSLHSLREHPENRRVLLDAVQSCKLIMASAQMFGFDEIGQLLSSIHEILLCIQSKEIQLTSKILDSATLAMELVVDLIENRSDGRGETGYIVDRLRELKNEQISSSAHTPESS